MEITTKPDAFGGSKRIPELDGLRGIAIFLVILCHYIGDAPHGISQTWKSMIATVLSQGAVGVDLFFILSGFLIGGILLNSKSSPRYYRTFYIRRFHRIIPLYYSWLILFGLIWFVASRFGGPAWAEFHPASPFWTFFIFIQNYVGGSNVVQSYWLVPLWSLAVEEQFYLIAPPLIRTLSVRGLGRTMAAVIGICLFMRVLLSTLYGTPPDYWGIHVSYFWTPCRADELALGVLIALIWSRPWAKQWVQDRTRFVYAGLIGCGLLLAVMDYWLLKPNSFLAATYGRTVIGLYFSFLMVIPLIDRAGLLARIFRTRVLRELGKISYCVYIIHEGVHWTVFRFLRHDTPRFDSWPTIGVTLIALVVTILVASLSWIYLENPLIHRGHRYTY